MGLEIQIDRKNKPTIKTVKFPVEYSDDAIQHPTAPPDLGEHNSEFLELLGYDGKSVTELKEKGVI
jgi:crotonobetainyl-CoA:carnitine CoA-transferase CaiB-like acyl-CoA transferase